MGKKFYESSKDASKGGFQGIKKVRGLMVDLDVVPAPKGWETDKMQMQASLEDALVLEMLDGEDEFELKEGKFSFFWPYGLTEEEVDRGRKPPAGGPWMKCAVASAEKLGKKPSDFVGSVVTLEKQEVLLFQQRDKEQPIGEDGKHPLVDITTTNYFCFIEDEDSNSENLKIYAREQIIGLNEKAARRKLLTNTRLKQVPELKERLTDGTLAEFLELTITNGKFSESTEPVED